MPEILHGWGAKRWKVITLGVLTTTKYGSLLGIVALAMSVAFLEAFLGQFPGLFLDHFLTKKQLHGSCFYIFFPLEVSAFLAHFLRFATDVRPMSSENLGCHNRLELLQSCVEHVWN